MQYNINIWTVLWLKVYFDSDKTPIPNVEIHKTYDSAMHRICELVEFTSELTNDDAGNGSMKISGLCMSEVLI